MADFNSSVLDAPDSGVRRILLKRQQGQRLSDQELHRLAQRMDAEDETMRFGGTVQNPITRRRLTPQQMGAQDRAADEGYAAGYEGRTPAAPTPLRRAPVPAPNGGNAQGSLVAPVRSAAPRPLAPAAAPAMNDEAETAGDTDNEAAETAPAAPAANPITEDSADKALRRRFGRPPNERGQIDVAPGQGQPRSIAARRLY